MNPKNHKIPYWWYFKYFIICVFSLVIGIYISCNTKKNIVIFLGSLFMAIGILGAFVLISVLRSVLKESDTQIINNTNISKINTTEDEIKILSKVYDPLFLDVVEFLIQYDKVSALILKKKYAIGFNRANRLIEQLAEAGVIESGTSYLRNILIHNDKDWQNLKKGLLSKLSKPLLKENNISSRLKCRQEFKESNFGATKIYFDKVLNVTTPLCIFYDKILKNRKVLQCFDEYLTDYVGDSQAKLRLLFLSDLVKCYNRLGNDATNLLTIEGLPMTILEGHTISATAVTYSTIQLVQYREMVKEINGLNIYIAKEFLKDKLEDFFYMNEIFKACNTDDLRTQYFSLLYRFFSVIAKADGHITPEEGKWLGMLMSYSTTSKDYGLEVFEKEAGIVEKLVKEKQSTTECLNHDGINPIEKLQSLIGLSEVKEEVSALANFVRIQQEREKKGMKAVGLSYHCVFTGNPGTGKTTVARIVAEIYKNLGILKKGHLVETDRSGLVAEYVGQTAVKTNKIIDSAIDGVLFIDEAYSLVQGTGNDYGQEAISTLLKRMEDERERLVVILAGYSEDMKRFIDSNPGLQSRFNRYIHFSDYSAVELKQIFMLHVKKNQYLLEPESEERLSDILNFAVEHKDKNFGNGRYVRNLFEKTIQNQAMRLSCKPNITAKELSKLKAEDLPTNK